MEGYSSAEQYVCKVFHTLTVPVAVSSHFDVTTFQSGHDCCIEEELVVYPIAMHIRRPAKYSLSSRNVKCKLSSCNCDFEGTVRVSVDVREAPCYMQ